MLPRLYIRSVADEYAVVFRTGYQVITATAAFSEFHLSTQVVDEPMRWLIGKHLRTIKSGSRVAAMVGTEKLPARLLPKLLHKWVLPPHAYGIFEGDEDSRVEVSDLADDVKGHGHGTIVSLSHLADRIARSITMFSAPMRSATERLARWTHVYVGYRR